MIQIQSINGLYRRGVRARCLLLLLCYYCYDHTHRWSCHGLVVPLPAANPADGLRGVILSRLGDNEQIDIGKALTATTPTTTTDENTRYVNNTKTMLILGTHPSDFNTIEYAQQVRAYWTQLPEFGIGRVMMTINGSPASCTKLVAMLDLPKELEVFADPTGIAGRKFGVDKGFRPDDNLIPTALKVTVVGLGFGPPWVSNIRYTCRFLDEVFATQQSFQSEFSTN
jgi:hypothetical protein